MIDVTPLTLSIETTGGVATPIITRNTIIPVTKTQIFSTTYNNQSNVDIKIVQGERLISSQNKLLGRFQLNDIEPAPAGVPQIEISFSIDINGIMSISARDLRTNKQNSITITNSSNLNNDQIQRMYREAQEYKEKDEQFRKQADI
ncbi:MAG: Hsp70 family protein, partial [Ureaplasma sp.]|nr:Hsp70 family protein [Ureaplasma sp.]